MSQITPNTKQTKPVEVGAASNNQDHEQPAAFTIPPAAIPFIGIFPEKNQAAPIADIYYKKIIRAFLFRDHDRIHDNQ